jgi:nitrite reductase/ring-hydroxylating ferredoxin subunit
MPTTTAPVADVVDRLERTSVLDPVVKGLRSVTQKVLQPQGFRDALHGVWLGHPLHPVLTDVPIGAWGAAAVLDAVPGTGIGASTLIAAGCAASLPTAVTGLADWSELHGPHQRVGVIHAAANVVALGFYTASLGARMRGRKGRGKVLAYAGLAAMSVGGYLGGHLAFGQAAGANHGADIPDLFPGGWHDIGRLDELPEGAPAKRTIEGVDLLVLRRGQHVDVLSNKCSHLSGPLSDGEFTVEGGHGCIVCPWHGSTFRLSDGAVQHGPATSPQHRFDTRVTATGRLEVSLGGE